MSCRSHASLRLRSRASGTALRRRALVLALVLAVAVPALAAARADGIAWTECGPALQCARVPVPLDWKRRRGRTIELAVLRRLASRPAERIGTIFFNPGGPGSSGIEAIRANGELLDAMAQGRFDFVTWDPRGVGESGEVRCFESAEEETAFWGDLVVPSTPSDARRYAEKAKQYARRCGKLAGRLLRHVSTADTVRDLDHLRDLLGEPQLNYVGWSYGTFLGQTYANRWPDRVRAMVLDGVVDAVVYVKGREASLENISRPSDDVFAEFQAVCERAGAEKCALAGHGSVAARVNGVLERLRQGPIPAPAATPPGELTYGEALTAISPLLRGPGSWPQLAQGLEDAANGDGSVLETVARTSPPGKGGSPPPVAIGCADSPARRPLRAWPTVMERRLVGIGGPVVGWWLWSPCAAWPVRSAARYTGPWNARTPNPILVVGTRFDPNTAYANAQITARRLRNAVLLTHDGYGHISFVDPSRCVVRAMGDYLVNLTPPPPGTVCPSDRLPFDPDFGEPLPDDTP
jgi:pimeloyl-ACP methyl ester carboxylesterase